MQRSTALFLVLLGVLVDSGAIACLVLEVGGQQLIPLFVALIFLGAVLTLIGVFGVIFQASSSAGAASASASNGRFKPYEMEDLQVDGREYHVFFKPLKTGKNGHPSALTISVPAELPTSLQFNAENWFDRLCKTLGIAREHQTGDARFDEMLYVRAPLESYAERYLADAAKREAVVALKETGFQEIKVTENEGQAAWSGFQPATHDRPGLIEDAARHLLTLTSNLPKSDPQLDEPEWRIDWHGPLWAFVLLYAVSFACAFWFQPVRVGDLMSRSLLVYAMSWVMLAWFAAFLLRGRSTSHDQWIVLVAVGLVAMLLGSIGTVSAVNALADTAPHVERSITVSDKQTRRGKKSTSYYLCVPDWNAPGKTVEFGVSSSTYSRATVGRSEVLLVTNPGALGIEWLHSKDFRL